jgi:hypothetical protein
LALCHRPPHRHESLPDRISPPSSSRGGVRLGSSRRSRLFPVRGDSSVGVPAEIRAETDRLRLPVCGHYVVTFEAGQTGHQWVGS